MLVKYRGYGSLYSVKDNRFVDIGQLGFLYDGVFALLGADANNLTIMDELEIRAIQPIEHPSAPVIIPSEYRNKDFQFQFTNDRGGWYSQIIVSKNPLIAKCSIHTNTLEFLDAIPEEIAQQIGGKNYISLDVIIVLEAVEKFWKLADPDDKTTHPSKEKVKKWLMEKGLSSKVADASTTLISPSWAGIGRPKNK